MPDATPAVRAAPPFDVAQAKIDAFSLRAIAETCEKIVTGFAPTQVAEMRRIATRIESLCLAVERAAGWERELRGVRVALAVPISCATERRVVNIALSIVDEAIHRAGSLGDQE